MGQFEGKQESWLTQIYSATKTARIIDKILLLILILPIFISPLPFGSVQPDALLSIQLTALAAFGLWWYKLLFGGDPAQLEKFQEDHRKSKQTWKDLPFFQRHLWLAQILRLLTLGNWPKRNLADTLVTDQTYNALADYEHAAASYLRYAELTPNDPAGYNHAADVFMQLGRYDRAREYYQRALQRDPQNTHALARLHSLNF